jgi:hypothetical protein
MARPKHTFEITYSCDPLPNGWNPHPYKVERDKDIFEAASALGFSVPHLRLLLQVGEGFASRTVPWMGSTLHIKVRRTK